MINIIPFPQPVVRIIGFTKNDSVMFTVEDHNTIEIMVEQGGKFWHQNPKALSKDSPNRWLADTYKPALAARLKIAIMAVNEGKADLVPRPDRPVNKAALAATSRHRVHASGAAIRSASHARHLDSNAEHMERHQ